MHANERVHGRCSQHKPVLKSMCMPYFKLIVQCLRFKRQSSEYLQLRAWVRIPLLAEQKLIVFESKLNNLLVTWRDVQPRTMQLTNWSVLYIFVILYHCRWAVQSHAKWFGLNSTVKWKIKKYRDPGSPDEKSGIPPLPISGTASEVAGMVSATRRRNTIRDSKMVTPGKEIMCSKPA